MKSAGLWVGSVVASMAVHGLAGAGLVLMLRPDPVPEQTKATHRLDVAAVQVRRGRAEERRAAAMSGSAEATTGSRIGQTGVRHARADPASLPATVGHETLANSGRLSATEPHREATVPLVTATAPLRPEVAEANRAERVAVPSDELIEASAPRPTALARAPRHDGLRVGSVQVTAETQIAARPASAERLPAGQSPAVPAPRIEASGQLHRPGPVTGRPAELVVPVGRPASAGEPHVVRVSGTPVATSAELGVPVSRRPEMAAPVLILPAAASAEVSTAGTRSRWLKPQTAALPAHVPATQPVEGVVAIGARAHSLPSDTPVLPPRAPATQPVERVVAAGTRAHWLAPEAAASPPRLPAAQPVERVAAAGARVGAVSPQAKHAGGLLQWTGDAEAELDPVSLAALQAFVPATVADQSGSATRDRLVTLLESVECARVQAAFVPEEGVLELRGHVPNPALADELTAALASEIGRSLPVRDRLIHLPAPQCTALSGLAASGLPQSIEQADDPLLIGAQAHLRVNQFSRSQRLVLGLQAPEYPAYLYLDYFDTSGAVVHLLPNAAAPLRRFPANVPIVWGAREAGEYDVPFEVRIAPPFGQEIAVVVASSVPLYEGLRPISEPAGPYLEFLAKRVAALRAQETGYKGEWAYQMIVSRP